MTVDDGPGNRRGRRTGPVVCRPVPDGGACRPASGRRILRTAERVDTVTW